MADRVSGALVWTLVGVVAGVGALGRFALDRLVEMRNDGGFPLGTLAVNLTGAFALGALAGRNVGGDALLLVGTAGIGSYTTYSTWLYESHHLAEDGERRMAVLNMAAGVAGGLAAAGAGWALGAAL
ncbi:MAG: fluoride efflux transporter CrcB [Gaiellales bacterium]